MYIIQKADGNNFELLTSFLLLKKDSISLFPFLQLIAPSSCLCIPQKFYLTGVLKQDLI